MPTAKNEVKLKFGTKAKYKSATKNADTVYFITDTNQIFVGSSLVSSKCYYVTSSPVASNYGVGDVVIWKISDNSANICVVNSSGEFDTFTISIPTDEITANTDARHSHGNKAILDKITGIVTKDNYTNPSAQTDLIDYSGFVAGSNAILAQTVHTDHAQSLSDAQKTQARTNIGALGTVVPNPTSDNDAANKAYVDSKVAAGGVTVDSNLSTTSVNPVQNKVITNSLNSKANSSDVLSKTNTAAFTPSGNYQPATKKYVDDNKLSVDTSLSSSSTNPVQNKVVKSAIDEKASITIKSWTADDVGGVDVTLSAGTTYVIDEQSLNRISDNIQEQDDKIIIKFPAAIVADDAGSSLISDGGVIYVGYGYDTLNDRQIIMSKFDPTNLFGSEQIAVTYTYPYVMYTAGDISGTGAKMQCYSSATSASNLGSAQIMLTGDAVVSTKQKSMLVE